MKLSLLGLILFASTTAHSELWLKASWYGESHRGRTMANGQRFNPDALTCASWTYPLGSSLRISNRAGQSVIVTVHDRGPAKRLLKTRQLDLSRAAFEKIAGLELGIETVKVEVIND